MSWRTLSRSHWKQKSLGASILALLALAGGTSADAREHSLFGTGDASTELAWALATVEAEGEQSFSLTAGSADQAQIFQLAELQVGADEDLLTQLGRPAEIPAGIPAGIPGTSLAGDPLNQRAYAVRLGLDLRDLVTSPARMEGRHWRRLGLGVAAIGVVSAFDGQIRDAVYRPEQDSSYRFAESIRPIAMVEGLGVVGITWIAGQAFDKPKLRAVAGDAFEASFLAAGVVTPLLKETLGRVRPRDGDSQFFQGGGASFPSGEVTQAFALASVISAHNERKWVKVAAYGTAALIGWERLRLDAHWASDITAGALIGASVGHWVVRRNRPELRERRRWAVSPQVGPGSYGVGVSARF